MKRRGRAFLTFVTVCLLPGMLSAQHYRGVARTNVNQNRNVNANRNVNMNVNRNVNVNVHGGYYGGGYCGDGCCYHPVAVAAVTATAVVTVAIVGSMVQTLPPACSVVVVNGLSYKHCGSTWYQPQFS
jgi:hypothetical protein